MSSLFISFLAVATICYLFDVTNSVRIYSAVKILLAVLFS
jgi:hypothetical protein